MFLGILRISALHVFEMFLNTNGSIKYEVCRPERNMTIIKKI